MSVQEKAVNGKVLKITKTDIDSKKYVEGESFARRLLAYTKVQMVKVFDMRKSTKLLIRAKEGVKIQNKTLPDRYEITRVTVKNRNTYIWLKK